MARRQAAIKVGQAYIPVEVALDGLADSIRKQINDELKKVGREYKVPADPVEIPVEVEPVNEDVIEEAIVEPLEEAQEEAKTLGVRLREAFARIPSVRKEFAYLSQALKADDYAPNALFDDKVIQALRRGHELSKAMALNFVDMGAGAALLERANRAGSEATGMARTLSFLSQVVPQLRSVSAAILGAGSKGQAGFNALYSAFRELKSGGSVIGRALQGVEGLGRSAGSFLRVGKAVEGAKAGAAHARSLAASMGRVATLLSVVVPGGRALGAAFKGVASAVKGKALSASISAAMAPDLAAGTAKAVDAGLRKVWAGGGTWLQAARTGLGRAGLLATNSKAGKAYRKFTQDSYKVVRHRPTEAESAHGLPGAVELVKVDAPAKRLAQSLKAVYSQFQKVRTVAAQAAGPLATAGSAMLRGAGGLLRSAAGAARATAGLAGGVASTVSAGLSAGFKTVGRVGSGVLGGLTSAVGGALKGGFSLAAKTGGAALKLGFQAVKIPAESLIQGGINSFKTLGRRAGQAFGIASAAATAYAGKTAVGMYSQFETAEIGMTTMLGSAEKAKGMLDELAKFAAKTPFELSGIVDSSKQLIAYGFNAQDILPILNDVGDAAGALGLGNEGVDRITRALGQFKVKGRVMAEEMLQLTETGIPAYEMLAEHYGVTVKKITEMVHKGEVDAQTGIQALREGMHKRYDGLMAKQAETLSGIMSNIKDQFGLTMKDLFGPLAPQVKSTMKQVLGVLEQTAVFANTKWPEMWQRISTDPMGYLNEMFPTIKAYFKGLDWAGMWGNITSSFKYVWDGLKQLSGQVDWKGVGKSLVDALWAGLQGAWGLLGQFGDMLWKWVSNTDWASVGQTVLNGLVTAFNWINTQRTNMTINLLDWIDQSTEGMDFGATGFQIGDTIRKAVESLFSTSAELGSRLYEWFAGVDWGQLASNIAQFGSGLLSGLLGGSGSFGDDLSKWFNNVDWAGVELSVLGVAENIRNALSNALQGIMDFGGMLASWFQNINWADVGEMVQNGIRTGFGWLLGLLEGGVKLLWPAIDGLLTFLVAPETWAGITNTLIWLLDTVWKLVLDLGAKIWEWIKSIDLLKVGEWLLVKIGSVMVSIWTIVSKLVGAGLKWVWGVITDIVGGIMDAIGNLVWDAINAIGKKAYDLFGGFLQPIVDALSPIIDKLPGMQSVKDFLAGKNKPAESKPYVPGGLFKPVAPAPVVPEFNPGLDFPLSSPFMPQPAAGGNVQVHQHFGGHWIEPKHAQRAAMLGVQAGV